MVDIVRDREEAAILGSTELCDMIIFDIGLPKRDGILVLKELRSEGIDTHVLILTARDGWSERVDGLDAGSDDYLTKFFHMPELSARMRAILRRKSGVTSPVSEMGDIEFDTRLGRVLNGGFLVDLTSQDVAVLSYLVRNTGRLISRTQLFENTYEYDGDRVSNTIAVFVTRLCKKLGPELIQTVRGSGYLVDEN